MTQAMTLEKMLLKNGHEVVGIMVGTSATRKVPEFFLRAVSAPVTEYTSINFRPSHKNRKPNMVRTVLYNVFAFVKYFPSIRRIRRTAIETGADVVVNFYELLVGLAYMGRRLKVPCVSIGHQYLFLHKGFGLPLMKYPGHEGINVLSRINSFGSCKLLALSFNHLPDDPVRKIRVVPPLLRPDVLNLRNPDGSPTPATFRPSTDMIRSPESRPALSEGPPAITLMTIAVSSGTLNVIPIPSKLPSSSALASSRLLGGR